ncbi:MAG: hypothetical protein HYX57_12760 [Chloroflexi bacterium]|nr:hypothetical protein [Chloroflexota bacterium]
MGSLILRTALVLAAAGLLGACSPAATGVGTSASPRTVELTMTDQLTFEPARIQVRRGETIRFVVRNASKVGHEAYVGTEEEQQVHAQKHGLVPIDRQWTTSHMGYGIHVAPLGSGVLVVKFDQPYQYVIGCHYPGHYAAGMRAVIEVAE